MSFVLTDGSNGVIKYPYSVSQLKADNPNTSFPKSPKEHALNSFNVYFVTDVPKPTAGEYETVREGTPVFDGSKWLKSYSVAPMFVEYVDDNGVTVTVQDQIDAKVARELTTKRERMTCTPRQARLVLAQTGRYGAVKSFMAGLPVEQKETAEIEWEYATTFERTSGVLTTLTAAMGMTEEEVDDLFDLAVTL